LRLGAGVQEAGSENGYGEKRAQQTGQTNGRHSVLGAPYRMICRAAASDTTPPIAYSL
jgi:hypothetical protein